MFGPKFKEWSNKNANVLDGLGALGVGLSQWDAGQPVNIIGAWDSIQNRRAQRKFGEAMRDPNLMAGFSPEQQTMLAQMPAEMAQQLIMEKLFAAPAKPEYREFNGDLIDMTTGKVFMDGMSLQETEAAKLAEERKRREADAAFMGYAPDSPEYKAYVVGGDLPKGAGATSYGTTLQFFTDESGRTRAGVLGSDGSMKEIQPPDGGDWASGIEKVDAGTKWLIYDRRTGEKIGEEVKDIRGAEAEKAIGEAEGKSVAAAPGDITTADTTLGYIDSLRNHPGREWGTGGSSFTGLVPGSDSREFQLEVERLKSGAFMTAIQELRGMGALSNAEGQTATAAVAALDTSGTEEGFLKRLEEYERIVKLGRERAEKRIKAPEDTPTGTPDSDGWVTLPNGVKVREVK